MNRNDDAGPGGLTGVVLCGGKSRRMGRDKGLIEKDGVSWAAQTARKLANCGLPVLYSIRAEQAAAYAAKLGEAALVEDSVTIGGPLNGLLSIHLKFPEKDLLMIACDMQDMDEVTIGNLVNEYKKGGAEFYVYFDGDLAEPFCAIYTAAGLERVKEKLRGERRLRTVIGMGHVRKLAITRREAFGNYNFS